MATGIATGKDLLSLFRSSSGGAPTSPVVHPAYNANLPSYAPNTPTYPGLPNNVGASGNVNDVAAALTKINIANQNAANLGRIPGAAGLEEQSSSNIAQELAGNVPIDVINRLGQAAAERGITGSNVDSDYLKALGLSSLQMQRTGQEDLTGAYARNPAAPIYDVSNLVLNAQQQEAARQAQAALAEQTREAQMQESYRQQQLAEQSREFGQTYALDQEKLRQSTGLSYAQLAQQAKLQAESEAASLEQMQQQMALSKAPMMSTNRYLPPTTYGSPFSSEPNWGEQSRRWVMMDR